MKSKVLSSLSLLAGISLTLGSCLNDNNVTPYQQLQEDIAEIDAYLEANPSEDPSDIIVRDAQSGIRMVITERPAADVDGTEPVPVAPTLENTIRVGYVGRILSNGQIGDPFGVDDSYVFTMRTDDAGGEDVIQGWKFALSMMLPGMKATVYIPSGLAYGTKGKGSIPGNSILVFDLDLKEVDTSNEEPQFTQDEHAISVHLEGQEGIIIHPNRFSYKVRSVGTGERPDLYDQVEVKYTGMLLNGTIFAEDIVQGPVTSFSARPANYIHGLSIGLQLMQQGSKYTFYVPSVLGYGAFPPSGSNIPANANLIFEIELIRVIPNPQ